MNKPHRPFGNDKHAAYLRSLTDPRRMDAVRELRAQIAKRGRTAQRSEHQRDYDEYLDEQGLTPLQGYQEGR